MPTKQSGGSVSLQVIVRCRPFSCEDQIGVFVDSANEKQGKTEVMLVNGNHSTRYPFNHSWWSAFGYERHVQPDEDGVYKRLGNLGAYGVSLFGPSPSSLHMAKNLQGAHTGDKHQRSACSLLWAKVLKYFPAGHRRLRLP